MRQILVDKSILRERMVYKFKLAQFLDDSLFAYFIVYVPFIVTIRLWFFPSDNDHQFGPIFFGCLVLIDAWMLMNAYFIHKLVVFKGVGLKENSAAILKTLNELYPDITFSSGNSNLIRGQQKETFWKRKVKIISVLLDQSNVYINVLPTFKGGSLYLFGGIISYLRSRKIANEFGKNLNY